MQSLVKTCLLKSRLVIGWLSTTLTSPVYSNTGHLCWDLQGQSLSCRMTKPVCSDVFFFFSYPITSTLLNTCTDMKIIKSYYIMFRDLHYWILADTLIVGLCWIWYIINKHMFFCTGLHQKLLLRWTSCYRSTNILNPNNSDYPVYFYDFRHLVMLEGNNFKFGTLLFFSILSYYFLIINFIFFGLTYRARHDTASACWEMCFSKMQGWLFCHLVQGFYFYSLRAFYLS